MGGRSNGHFRMRQKPTASPSKGQFCLTGGEDIPLDICIHSQSISATWKGASITFPTGNSFSLALGHVGLGVPPLVLLSSRNS